MRVGFVSSSCLIALLGSGCNSVTRLDPDAAGAADAAPDAAPDATPPSPSCAQILAATPGAPSGLYAIDPDGPGGADPFTVDCEMVVLGGGWTPVIDKVAASLSSAVGRQYLYLYGVAGYVSPCSTDVWSWTSGSGQALSGTWAYFNDTTNSSFVCTASAAETPSWGVGCSNGGGPTNKVLPTLSEDPAAGVSEICQDQPNIFGAGSCVYPVKIFEREGCTP
jgi:predicted ribosomally synthesized peptide with SipW-like signal peptide